MTQISTMNIFTVALFAFANCKQICHTSLLENEARHNLQNIVSHCLPNPVPNPVVNYALAARETPATPNANNNPGLAGNKAGKQFITGLCTSDADCASGCCGFNSGLCAGAVIAQTRDGGCGFGNAQPNDNAAKALEGGSSSSSTSSATTGSGSAAAVPAAAAPAASPSAAAAAAPPATGSSTTSSQGATSSTNAAGQFDNPAEAGNKQGKQFITGLCTSDADCESGCCGFNTGLCAGAVIAQTRDGGCGFGNAQPNDNAAKALAGK